MCFIYKDMTGIGIVSTFKEKMKNSLFITTSALSIKEIKSPPDVLVVFLTASEV